MDFVIGNNANHVWNSACDDIYHTGNVTESRDLKNGEHIVTRTKELLHYQFVIHDPRQRIVFSRPINPAFAIAEVLWILCGSSKADFLLYWNPRMKRWMNKDKTFHGAYGSRLGIDILDCSPHKKVTEYFGRPHSNSEFNQLHQAYRVLKETPHSRQVVLQIWDHELDFPNPDSPVSIDVPCNIISDLKVRDGKLYWLQVMRSNDLIWGTPYNFIQWTSIQEIVAGWLGLKLGTYTHIASSLHVYEKHWDHLKEIVHENEELEIRNEESLMVEGYDNWLKVFYDVLYTVYHIRCADISVLGYSELVSSIELMIENMPIAYKNICWLLLAEHFRKYGYLPHSRLVSDRISDYWRKSWLNWFEFNHKYVV